MTLKRKIEELKALGSIKVEPSITFPHDVWDESLRNHPNHSFYTHIMHGNRWGYDIGIKRNVKLDKNSRNLPTNVQEKIAITD